MTIYTSSRDAVYGWPPDAVSTWWASPETPRPDLLGRLLRFVLPAAVVTMVFGVGIYIFFYEFVLNDITSYHILPDAAARWEAYTGLSYQTDKEFGPAAATIVAQTALSTFVVPDSALDLATEAVRPLVDGRRSLLMRITQSQCDSCHFCT